MFVLFKNVMPKKRLIQLGLLFCNNAIFSKDSHIGENANFNKDAHES